jgi:hypothetical protein
MPLLSSGVLKKSPSNAFLKTNAVKHGTSWDWARRASYWVTLNRRQPNNQKGLPSLVVLLLFGSTDLALPVQIIVLGIAMLLSRI